MHLFLEIVKFWSTCYYLFISIHLFFYHNTNPNYEERGSKKIIMFLFFYFSFLIVKISIYLPYLDLVVFPCLLLTSERDLFGNTV